LAIFIWYSAIFESGEMFIYSVLLTIFFAMIIPVLVFLKLRRSGHVSDFDAKIKEERALPFGIGIAIHLTALVLSWLIGLNPLISALWFIYAVNTFILLIITRFWKISAHAMGAGGFSGALFFLDGVLGIFSLILVVVTCYTRLYLKVHTIAQVIAGSILSFLLVYLQLLIWKGFIG